MLISHFMSCLNYFHESIIIIFTFSVIYLTPILFIFYIVSSANSPISISLTSVPPNPVCDLPPSVSQLSYIIQLYVCFCHISIYISHSLLLLSYHCILPTGIFTLHSYSPSFFSHFSTSSYKSPSLI